MPREALRVERAGGGVEQRDAVGARLRLQRHVGREQLGQRLAEARVQAGREPGQALAREALVRAGNRIGIERERRADEADQRACRRAGGA